jgi:NAD(P)-dependent dehydrogenase (short-subunit alcohol dehydrogenase family)
LHYCGDTTVDRLTAEARLPPASFEKLRKVSRNDGAIRHDGTRAALVTGAGRWARRAVVSAVRLAEGGGPDVAIVDRYRRGPGFEETALPGDRALGRKGRYLPLDTLAARQLRVAVERRVAEFGRLDALFRNVAGSCCRAQPPAMTDEAWDI